MCWLKPVCERNFRKIRGLTHHNIVILYKLISYAQSYQETWNCTFSLQHAKKSVRTDLQQSLSLVICSTFEVLHCWILQKIVQEWMLRHLAKSFTTAWQLYNSIFKEYYFLIWRRAKSFQLVIPKTYIKSYTIGKFVKVITTLSVWRNP